MMTRSRLSRSLVVCVALIAACAQVPAGPGARRADWGRRVIAGDTIVVAPAERRRTARAASEARLSVEEPAGVAPARSGHIIHDGQLP